MREKLHLQKRAMVDDGYGNEVAGDFVTVFTAPAELVPMRGGEGVQAARLTGTQPYIVLAFALVLPAVRSRPIGKLSTPGTPSGF